MPKETVKNEDLYFKVKPIRTDWLGERYFRYNPYAEKVIQVCVNPGEIKKGRTSQFGVYMIHRNTFLANYFTYGYVEPITKRKYESKMKLIVNLLSN